MGSVIMVVTSPVLGDRNYINKKKQVLHNMRELSVG